MPDIDAIRARDKAWVRSSRSCIEEQAHIDRRALLAEIDRLRQWVDDLQSGMYINCVYCGYQYGPDPGTPAAMAEVLKRHIEQCPEHPLSHAKAEVERLRSVVQEIAGMKHGDEIQATTIIAALDTYKAET